ncbi:hypothetical protein TrLO_g4325 [Triparma laevis f. longispina]|uniref:Replication protein A subunit n=1 Tax=Triparma laevis f. longispina TaxID=1714387 RepID=A0A9W7FMN2_9STRA|nr:hypothetical protein TrLO_g4325 [Triparma laevis f. longispina]
MQKIDVANPHVQVINIKKVGTQDRYRVILSDGTHYIQGMLATQLNNLITENHLVENAIVCLKEFITNVVQDKTVLILLKCEIVSIHGSKIGNPTEVYKADIAAAGAAKPVGGMYNAPPPAPAAGGGSNYSNPYNQPSKTSSGGGSGPTGRSGLSSNIIPIGQLNPYQNKWVIQGRITNKGDMRTWNNAKGEGCLFSIDILDSSGMDIRGTFFKEDANKWHSVLEVDKIYTFSGGRLKVANPQWNKCKCQHEITFDRSTDIQLQKDDDSIPQNMFDFSPIGQLESTEPEAIIDIIGVVASISPVSSITAKKTGNELKKCELTVMDDSEAQVNVTLWGKKAETAENEYAGCPVVAFKGLKVSDFGGRSCGTLMSSAILKNPRIPETEKISAWFQNRGANATVKNLSTGGGGAGRITTFEERKTVSAIRNEQLGYNEKPDWLSFKATVSFIKKDKEGGPWYPACPNAEEPCKNMCKVISTSDDHWQCEKCNKQYDKCCRRYIFSATLSDNTSTCWASIFNDQALGMLQGHTADELNEWMQNGDYDKFEKLFDDALFTEWIVKAKVKSELVSEEQRVKTTAYAMTPIDYAKESKELLKAIKNLQ